MNLVLRPFLIQPKKTSLSCIWRFPLLLWAILATETILAQNVRPYLPGTDDYDVTLPAHYFNNGFPGNIPGQNSVIANDNTPANNPTTDAGARLGRVLFYEKKLSASGTVSCASCHQQSAGFSDPVRLSVGHAGGTTRRNSMGLGNARFYSTGKFFWDERANTLEEQVLEPIQDSVEMGLTLDQLLEVVRGEEYYAPLFTDAFGTPGVSTTRIARALAQFVRSLASVDSKYDRSRANVATPTQDFPGFTAQENLGKRIFMLRENRAFACIECHVGEAFLGAQILPQGATTVATNNGLENFSVFDLGVEEATGNPADAGKFKVPSLKNIALTGPFMHDGSLQTLDDVMRHYRNVENHPNLSPPLRQGDGGVARFNLNGAENDAVVAFMETLTDETLISAERFSDPFRPLWQPSGWHFSTSPYLYDHGAQQWHYLSEESSNRSWHIDLVTGEWAQMDATSGWLYFSGNYFYSSSTSRWHYYAMGSDQWTINFGTGDWALLIR